MWHNDRWNGLGSPDILVPERGIIPDELLHYARAFGMVRVDHDNAMFLKKISVHREMYATPLQTIIGSIGIPECASEKNFFCRRLFLKKFHVCPWISSIIGTSTIYAGSSRAPATGLYQENAANGSTPRAKTQTAKPMVEIPSWTQSRTCSA